MLSLRDKIRVALQNARRAGDSYAVSRLEKALQPMGMAQAPNLREYVPTPSNVPQPQIDPRLSPLDQAEQLSMGLGTAFTSGLEGTKQLVTDPIGSAKALYEGGREIVRNPALLGEMAQDIYGRATSGPMGFGEVVGEFVNPLRVRSRPVMREIDVYHGSPHRFEEFDASKIGTGEGAQAYGHGIYLAESPDVAEGYRRDLSDKISVNDTVLVDKNRVIGSTGDEAIDDYLLAHRGNLDEAIKDLQKEINKAKADYPHAVPLFEEEMQKLKALRGRVKVEQGGSLYTADLPDEMVDRMLDWDKPLSEQPAVYKAIRATIPADVVKDFDANVERGITGGNAYSNWVWGGKTPAGRSEKLRELGIPGIKYADAGSRGQGGGGTRNFVVFPGEEKKVKVKKRD